MTLATMGKPTFQSLAYAPGLRTPFAPMFPSLWDGAVGAWCMSLGPTGGTLYDFSGYQNDGTLTNMDPDTDLVIDGGGGYALDFDGSNDYVDFGTHPPSKITNSPMTVSAWTKPNIGSGYRRVINRELHFLFGAFNSQFLFAMGNGVNAWNSLTTFGADAILTNGVWYNLVASYDGSSVTGHVNGVDVGSITANMVASSRKLFLSAYDGGFPVFGQDWKGLIDDVRIYNRVLSPEEIFVLSGFGGHEALGRGIAYRTRDDVNFLKAAEAAAGGFPFQLYYQQRRQRGYSELEPTEYEE
jgi:hypothetical protein